MNRPRSFKLPFEGCLLRGDRYKTRCRTVVLHGAGKSSRKRFLRLRSALSDLGIATVGFDYIGHGETGGELLGSSLRHRTEQAASVIRYAGEEPLTLIGASMSAYTAIRLTRRFRVDTLALLVPAVYTARAYHVPFGPAFSTIIRAPRSWQDSDAWDILAGFRGNLLVIAAERDEVIPVEIVDRIYASAKNAESKIVHVVPGSRHLLLFPKDRDFDRALEMIVRTFKRKEMRTT